MAQADSSIRAVAAAKVLGMSAGESQSNNQFGPAPGKGATNTSPNVARNSPKSSKTNQGIYTGGGKTGVIPSGGNPSAPEYHRGERNSSGGRNPGFTKRPGEQAV